MLLIDKKQVTLKEVERLLGVKIDIDKIIKKPLFEINPAMIIKDPANGPMATRSRAGMEFPAYFRVRLKSGEDIEIRYCTNRTPDKDTHGATEKFTPKKVPFDGKAEFISDDNDKALYYFLHPYNRQSPFRGKGFQYENKPFEFEFQDNEAKADAKIAFIELRQKAIAHANSLNGEELIITAKGMNTGNGQRIQGIEAMEQKAIKARLMEFADINPQAYLDSAESNVNHMVGLIFDAIDKQIFVLDNKTNSNKWTWAIGPRKGELIVELSKTVPNVKEALVTHIQQTPGVLNDFLPSLINTRKLVAAAKNIETELSGVNVMDMIKGGDGAIEENDELDENDAQTSTGNDDAMFPTEFKECSNYLKAKIGKGTPALAGKLWNAIKSGEVDQENVDGFLEMMTADQE